MRPTRIRPLLLAALFAGAGVAHAQAGAGGVVGLNEEEARFTPGLYYFHKGCDDYSRGDHVGAMHAWQVAAGWAMKDAQYDLGIAYFRGRGVAIDRPRGLAWLALAAERRNPTMQASLAAAWDGATDAEHQQANAIWRDLKKQYGDDVALPKAKKRFETELGQIAPNQRVVSRTMGAMDGKAYREKLEAFAEKNFGDGSASDPGQGSTAAAKNDAG